MEKTLSQKSGTSNELSQSKPFDVTILMQVFIVLGGMLSIKALADYFQITGAGSIGIWTGIIIATVFMKRGNLHWSGFGLRLPRGRREWFSQIGLALLTVVVIFLIMGLVMDPILTGLGLEKAPDTGDRFRFFLGKPAVFIAYLVTVVWVGAGLGEELLMRGFLLNRFADFLGNNKASWLVALIVHAIIFGSLHIYQGLYGVISTGLIGLIFGVVYLLSKRRLFILILAHILINTITLTAFYLSGGEV